MALTYQAGRRIQGTAADRAAVDAVSGGWKEVGRTTLGTAGDTITVSSIPDKRYYMVLYWDDNNSTTEPIMRFNNDSGSNYSARSSTNGATDGTNTNATYAKLGIGTAEKKWGVIYITNKSDKEKLAINQNMRLSGAGAGNAPHRYEQVFKWVNTSSALNRIDMINNSAGNFGVGSEVVVLGYDPDDTHTDNFWEELASVENSGGSTNNFGTGSFTAKKYLWIQAFVKNDGLVEPRIRVGTGGSIDTGSNIATRSSSNGGADGTATSRDDMVVSISGTSENHFINMFMVNNASNEKLAIHNCISVGTAGAGTAPQRREGVSKYSNTSAQVNIIEIEDNAVSAGIANGTIIKVWGSN